MENTNDDQILEGFLCPICKADFKSASQLTSHFESLHQEDQNVRKSLKDVFGKAKKKILNIDDSLLRDTFDGALRFSTFGQYYNDDEEQSVGVSRDSSNYFKAVRASRLERYATETNKLLIRLDKLICNMPSEPNQRKQHEQEVVPWLDGSSVKLCPSCAKSFNLTRRKHHCRLCGSLLCHECSMFLDLNVARTIVDPSAPQASHTEGTETSGLRLCDHCCNLIELRKQIQESRNAKSALVSSYEQMRSCMEEATPNVAMYEKMVQSLFNGETTYSLSDLNALLGQIRKLAEAIDVLSKHIASLPVDEGTKQLKLQKTIRQAAENYIQEKLKSLSKLPTESQIEEVRKKRLERARRDIELERRQMEMERLANSTPGPSRPNQVSGLESSNRENDNGDDSPLLEQMNIIRGYIKAARKELRFEEVAILEENLKELKKEYQLLKLSSKV